MPNTNVSVTKGSDGWKGQKLYFHDGKIRMTFICIYIFNCTNTCSKIGIMACECECKARTKREQRSNLGQRQSRQHLKEEEREQEK
jgi:hypothetical protein